MCCPDGLSCVPSSIKNPFNVTCHWTGQPIIPPPGYTVSPTQMVATASTNTTSVREMPAMDRLPVWIANNGTEIVEGPEVQEPSLRQGCTTGYVCPATTLPGGCSRTGPRWVALAPLPVNPPAPRVTTVVELRDCNLLP